MLLCLSRGSILKILFCWSSSVFFGPVCREGFPIQSSPQRRISDYVDSKPRVCVCVCEFAILGNGFSVTGKASVMGTSTLCKQSICQEDRRSKSGTSCVLAMCNELIQMFCVQRLIMYCWVCNRRCAFHTADRLLAVARKHFASIFYFCHLVQAFGLVPWTPILSWSNSMLH